MARHRTANRGKLIGAAMVGALAAGAPAATAQSLLRGPYLQSGSEERVTICWRTDVPCDSRVRYGLDPASLAFVVDDSASVKNHAVTITGLAPSTTWYYSVGTKAVTLAGGDAAHSFVTAPPDGRMRRTRVWVIGDSGTKDANVRAVRDAYYAATAARRTDLWIMLGDNAYDSGYDDEYQDAVFENMFEERLIDSVLWAAYGNHDALNADSGTQSGVYYDIFRLPANAECGGVPSGTEAYYSFDWGNVHFICLDSMESDRTAGGPMLTWLDADLAANVQEWVIAYWHHPPYSKGSHDSDHDTELIEMRQNAVDKLEEYGVDLVLCGHSHSYERSFLIDGHRGKSPSFDPLVHGKDLGDGRLDGTGPYRKPGAGMAPHEGAVYGVCGCSGKTESGALDHPAMHVGLLSLGSLVLDFHGAQLDVRFLDDAGVVRDDFTIVKGGATPVKSRSHVAIPPLSDWKYDDSGADLKTAWRAPDYDDSAWSTGPSTLGYGESYIATAVSWGSDPNDRYITTYFRGSFELAADPADVTALTLRASFDDGYVAYLNGVEVARVSMPAGTIDWDTRATSHEGGTYESLDLTPHVGLLVRGTNVLAVEVHQASASSSDLVWDAELVFDGFVPWLGRGAEGRVDPIGEVPYDVLRVNGSTGGLGRSVDVADGGALTIEVESPPSHGGSAPFALFAWFQVPDEDDLVPLGNMGDLCFPPIWWVANSLGIGPPGFLGSTPAPWSHTEPAIDAPLDVVLQGVIATKPTGALRVTNAVLVQVR